MSKEKVLCRLPSKGGGCYGTGDCCHTALESAMTVLTGYNIKRLDLDDIDWFKGECLTVNYHGDVKGGRSFVPDQEEVRKSFLCILVSQALAGADAINRLAVFEDWEDLSLDVLDKVAGAAQRLDV